MAVNRNHFIAAPEREAIVLLTALRYVEANALLGAADLRAAKQPLRQAPHAGSATPVLTPLRERLETARRLHHALASVSEVLAGAHRCRAMLREKQARLAARIAETSVREPAQREFLARFFAFSREFIKHCTAFAEEIARYSAAHEQEVRARCALVIRLAARRQHEPGISAFNGRTATIRAADIRVVVPFIVEHTAPSLIGARRDVATRARNVENLLRVIARLSALAAPPARRPPHLAASDFYRRFSETAARDAQLRAAADPLFTLLALYENAYRLLRRDYRKLNESLATLERNTGAYLREKMANIDTSTRRDRLRKIEALAAFVDQGACLAADDELYAYPKFSRELSAAICERRAAWQPIAGDLLRAKVHAEGEIGTQL